MLLLWFWRFWWVEISLLPKQQSRRDWLVSQEDFDVASGHVTIAAAGVDNTQLQNNRVSFADGNAVENFELDNELTATTGYRGFNKLNLR